MRSFWIAVSLAMAASPAYAQVSKTSLIDWGFYSVTGLVTSDNPSFSARAQARANGVTPAGGIYEIKLRIPYQDIEGYLADYKTFFLPVDQYVCSTTSVFTNKGANCESSGRKLVSVLTREHGDQFNLVFLYQYESAYKENYYCKYQKAFFQYHIANSTKDFATYYDQARTARNSTLTAPQTLAAAFPVQCSDPGDATKVMTDVQKAAYERTREEALDIARETIRRFNLIFASRVQSDEGSWYFDVNVCRVAELKANPAILMEDTQRAGGTVVQGLNSKCAPLESMLELAVETLKWDPK